jgi:glycyl-tRNA synthetase alpha subunit
MLEKRLPVPAYDMLLKCSHAFNILDARGAVGVTERADCFARMRALAREVTGKSSALCRLHCRVAMHAVLGALWRMLSRSSC